MLASLAPIFGALVARGFVDVVSTRVAETTPEHHNEHVVLVPAGSSCLEGVSSRCFKYFSPGVNEMPMLVLLQEHCVHMQRVS